MPDLLQRCGEALYGAPWRSPLARDLGVALRTVQRWSTGERPVPARVWPQLYALLSERGAAITALACRLAAETEERRA
jgi:hypothetical protein